MHRIVFSIALADADRRRRPACRCCCSLATGDSASAPLVRTAAVVAPLYFFVNTALVAGAIALSTRQPVVGVWQRNFLWSAPSYLGRRGAGGDRARRRRRAAGSAGSRCSRCRSISSSAATTRSSRGCARSRIETRRAMEVQLATIEALALAIEAKAGCTPEHIRSIQQYAATLAEAAGLSDAEVQAVRTAALLHDVGNMAVPEHILSKPEALTPEEFERVKIHPRVGAEILRNVPFGAPVERARALPSRALGRPRLSRGLRGEDIPLGARILAIADCYSTLQARSSVPAGAERGRGDRRAARVSPAPRSIRRWSICLIARLDAVDAAAAAERRRPARGPTAKGSRCRTSPARTARSRRSTRSRRRSARASASPTRWR